MQAEAEQKLHESITATLQHRIQILKTIANYLGKSDTGSVFRLLHNCENCALLQDGLRAMGQYLQARGGNAEEVLDLIRLSSKLFASKYESHIETSLQLLIQAVGMLRECPQPLYREGTSLLEEVVGSKKMRKLQEQTKNKHIFELGYELIHLTKHAL